MTQNIKIELPKIINAFNSGQYELVINRASILLKKNQDNDFLWNIKGLAFQVQRRYQLSIECFIKAVQINPNNLAALNNLGISHKKSMDYTAADKCFNKVIKINPSYIKALINLGNLRNETLDFAEAILFYKKAIDINDKISECHLNLAYSYQSIGEISRAKEHLNKTLKIDISQTRADKMLSALIDYTTDKGHLSSMIDKETSLELTDEKKIYLYFAIAKAFEDMKDFNKSFAYLEKGNQLQKDNTTYNYENIKKLSHSIKSFFSNSKLKFNNKEISKKKFIFIMGMPRSGTTLVEKIVSSHSRVSGLGELNIISNIIFNNVIKEHEIDTKKIDEFLNNDFLTSYEFYLKNFNIKNEYIVDKSLTNFWYIGFIKHFFPNSKIIHCSRNAKDNCLSIYKNLFDTHEGWFYDQLELARYYNSYEDLMKFWNKMYEGKIYNIEYELLIKNPDDEIKKLINFCSLDWEDACLNFHKSKTAIKTLSVNQANKPIYSSSVNSSDNYKDKLKILFSKLN
mgnify:FL=1|tara:strand:- start:1173 stop:2711 length:1539 start_codon:yes stop_codon:yes gene_type:complete